ncbi:MAG: hypothetical protein KIT57_09035 [Blastocatellales bacterium]|nr:hypothetical protein [Blastocatellales bacterium]
MAERKPLNLFDDFTINGQFWLPQHPDQKVSGTIEFNGGSEIRLALSGLLGKLEENYGLNFTPEIILGDLDDYRACTLLTNELLALENESKSTFDTRYLLIGKHYPTREEIRLPNLSFELSHLAEWIGSLPVSVRFGDRTKGEPVIFMSCGEAQEWSVKAPGSNSMITFESGYKINIDRAKHVHINHTPGIRIQPDGAQDFQSLLRTLGDLQFFMTLLIGTPTETPVYPLRVWSTESDVIQGSGREIPRQVDIYFTLSIGRRNTIGAHDVLLPSVPTSVRHEPFHSLL